MKSVDGNQVYLGHPTPACLETFDEYRTGEDVQLIFLACLILTLLIRSFTFLQADKLLRALKATFKMKQEKKMKNQVSNIFITYK